MAPTEREREQGRDHAYADPQGATAGAWLVGAGWGRGRRTRRAAKLRRRREAWVRRRSASARARTSDAQVPRRGRRRHDPPEARGWGAGARTSEAWGLGAAHRRRCRRGAAGGWPLPMCPCRRGARGGRGRYGWAARALLAGGAAIGARGHSAQPAGGAAARPCGIKGTVPLGTRPPARASRPSEPCADTTWATHRRIVRNVTSRCACEEDERDP